MRVNMTECASKIAILYFPLFLYSPNEFHETCLDWTFCGESRMFQIIASFMQYVNFFSSKI